MTYEAQETTFTDPRNICVGKARVIWAPACWPIAGDRQPEAWVLPGGVRTTNRLEAHAVAVEMDRPSQ